MKYFAQAYFFPISWKFIFVGGDFLVEEKGKMTVQEAGRRGGLKTSETHGEEFYSEIGRKGGKDGRAKMRTTSSKAHQ